MADWSRTATRPSASAYPARRHGAALPGVLALLAAGCARAPAPEPTPAPAPRPPTAQAPAGTPRVEQPVPVVRQGELAYAAGAFTYDVTSEASIELLRDSTFVRPTSLVDTLVTSASLSYQIAGEGADRLVTGAVDSFTVRSTGLVPGAREPYAGAIPFRALLLAGRMPVRFAPMSPVPEPPAPTAPAAGDSACVAPDAPLIALARDVLVPLPLSVAPGHAWQDTVSTTTCRAGIPVTTTAVRSYRVMGPSERDGVPALAVSRATQIAMTGQGTPRGQTVTVLGSGQGAGALFLDVAGGRYLGGTDSSTVELSISNGVQTRRFVQQARQETRLRRN